MELKDISRDRLEQIAQTLIDRVHEFEEWSNFFAHVLGYDGITLEEAGAFGYSFKAEDTVIHKIAYGYMGIGTYHLCFDNEETGLADATEFYANGDEELVDFWFSFCNENNFEYNWLTDVQYVCEERI